MNINIVKCLQAATEMDLMDDWVRSKKDEYKNFLEGFIFTVLKMKKKGGEEKPRWVLELLDTKTGLKELIGYHDKDNGYWDVAPLYYTIEESMKKEKEPFSQPHSDLQKRALSALKKELFCY